MQKSADYFKKLDKKLNFINKNFFRGSWPMFMAGSPHIKPQYIAFWLRLEKKNKRTESVVGVTPKLESSKV